MRKEKQVNKCKVRSMNAIEGGGACVGALIAAISGGVSRRREEREWDGSAKRERESRGKPKYIAHCDAASKVMQNAVATTLDLAIHKPPPPPLLPPLPCSAKMMNETRAQAVQTPHTHTLAHSLQSEAIGAGAVHRPKQANRLSNPTRQHEGRERGGRLGRLL